jgi:hypothetical protein
MCSESRLVFKGETRHNVGLNTFWLYGSCYDAGMKWQRDTQAGFGVMSSALLGAATSMC